MTVVGRTVCINEEDASAVTFDQLYSDGKEQKAVLSTPWPEYTHDDTNNTAVDTEPPAEQVLDCSQGQNCSRSHGQHPLKDLSVMQQKPLPKWRQLPQDDIVDYSTMLCDVSPLAFLLPRMPNERNGVCRSNHCRDVV